MFYILLQCIKCIMLVYYYMFDTVARLNNFINLSNVMMIFYALFSQNRQPEIFLIYV